jgi:hypothetical protein
MICGLEVWCHSVKVGHVFKGFIDLPKKVAPLGTSGGSPREGITMGDFPSVRCLWWLAALLPFAGKGESLTQEIHINSKRVEKN